VVEKVVAGEVEGLQFAERLKGRGVEVDPRELV
jgi:hypothetical protein